MSSDSEGQSSQIVLRRRPTRRHRRRRLIRRSILLFVFTWFAFGLAYVCLLHLSPSLFHASQKFEPHRRTTELERALIRAEQQELRNAENRPVYPYSIVPGGVKDAHELKYAADHDPLVRAHYAGFDYDHARVVRLVLARTVYLSYRIGNKVYWTRHRVTLKKGETLITDGTITARTRCANRVEEMPQQATSMSEPPAMKFDEPVQPVLGTATSTPPVPFQSALNTRPGVPGLGPAPPLPLYDPIELGSLVPINPPPLPGVCGGGKKKNNGSGGEGTGTGTGKKGKGNPCGSGGGGAEVPEPGTWFLFASGLAFIAWMNRRRFFLASVLPS